MGNPIITLAPDSDKPATTENLATLVEDRLRGMAADSPWANTLLTDARREGVTVGLKSNTDVFAVGKKVTCGEGLMKTKLGQVKADGFEEFVESMLFEIQNGVNHARFKALDDGLTIGLISLIEYGDGYSELEAESTWTVYQIIRELQAKTPPYQYSEWGKKQKEKAENYPSLQAFKPQFMQDPHETGNLGPAGLPSRMFYAYNKISGMTEVPIKTLICQAVTVTRNDTSGTMLVLDKISSILSAQSKYSGLKSKGAGLCTRYHIQIALIQWLSTGPLKKNFTVQWKNGKTAADWQFTTEMQGKAPDSQNALAFLQEQFKKPGLGS